jgi:hypothetical protein
LVASALAACSSSSANDTGGAGTDGGTTGDGATTGDGGVKCCPPDPTPGCCMKYGGAEDSNGQCEDVCDGMPNPSDPGWKLTTDSAGCSRWTNSKPDFGPGTCGYPSDSGSETDSGLDAQGD